MKCKMIAVIITLALLLVACGDTSAPTQESSQNETSSAPQSDSEEVVEQTTLDPEQVLLDFFGTHYFEGKAFMRADDEEIDGEVCAVFGVGTNTAEKFTTEQWLAVAPSGTVYEYDIIMALWSPYGDSPSPSTDGMSVTMDDCLYMLNEVYTEMYSVEYYDTEDQVKKAVYLNEDDFVNDIPPAMLIGVGESVPEGYAADPAEAVYYPIYNFTSLYELEEHLSLYFTQQYIDNQRQYFGYNFLEHDGTLYLVRGGRGYGMFGIDFDSIDYSKMVDNTLLIDGIGWGEYYGKFLVEFVQEGDGWKIASDRYIAPYLLLNINTDMYPVEVPDLLSFATNEVEYTATGDFEAGLTMPNRDSVTHYGDYYDILPEYITLLEMMGFEVTMDGHEGFYMLEQQKDGYLITVNAFFMNEVDAVTVEIGVQEAQG